MSDNFEFEKSCIPQGSNIETPYVSKNYQYINDINNSAYTNTSLSLVQFDLTSIYNSTKLTNPSECYLAIPITMVSVYTTGYSGSTPALGVPIAGSVYSTGMKPGYWNLIQGADVQWSGKQLEQYQQNINAYISYKMLSDMSVTDLKQLGPTLGLGSQLDNFQSARFNGSGIATFATGTYPGTAVAATNSIGGNGICNNAPFALTGNSNAGDQGAFGAEYESAYNNGLYSRLSRIISTDISNNQFMVGTASSTSTTVITNVTNLVKEFRPYYTVLNTNYMVWYDIALIRLCDLFDSFKNLPLTKRMDSTLRIYVNTGSVASVANGSAGLMLTSGSGISFTNTCPLIQCALKTLPSTVAATGIVSGLFIGTPPATSISLCGSTINFASAGAAHFMSNCRFYFPQIELKPNKLIPYLSENRSKQICFTSVLSNQLNNIGAGSTFSQLIQSGVTKVKSVIIIPFVSAATHGLSVSGTSITSFSPLLSPFSIAPNETGPISLINLNVSIGGVNMLQNVLSYSFENFLQQSLLFNNINGAQVGITCGLISQDMWTNNYRVYYVDCSRANLADLNSSRNVNVSFTNNSLQSIDCLVFTEYYRDVVIDVETGIIN